MTEEKMRDVTVEKVREHLFKQLNLIRNGELAVESDEERFARHLCRKHMEDWSVVKRFRLERYADGTEVINEYFPSGELSEMYELGQDVCDLLNEKEKLIGVLNYKVSALEYALRSIREIEVEIDVEGEIDD